MKNAAEKSKQFLNISFEEIPSKKRAEDVAEKLRKLIAFHDRQYYVYDDPVIADGEYDQLYELLKIIEKKWPELQTDDSPTHRVGSEHSGDFEKVEHLSPMLSLDAVHDEDGIRNFDKNVKEKTGEKQIAYTVEPKLDGAAVSLVFENDTYVRGSTRGDGHRGEDITANLKALTTVPLHAAFSKKNIRRAEVRGEVLISKNDFKKLNKKREKKGENLFANPRNAAAGSLHLKDPSIVAGRRLEFLAYQLSRAEDEDGTDLLGKKLRRQDECIQWLHDLGFKTSCNEFETAADIGHVIELCKKWENRRAEFPYEIDGVVIKVNRLDRYGDLALTSHHPRWALAFKFEARQATTTILDVNFQVGRTGAVTPVAVLEPVEIGGVTIQSATLHNQDFMEAKNLHYDDEVLVERAGDVIPYIVKRTGGGASGRKKISFPERCPSCDSKLERPPGEAAWRCLNVNCPAQIKERLKHFTGKSALDVEGLGSTTIRLFYEKKIVRSLPGIFEMDFGEIRKLDGFGEKSSKKLQQALEKAKSRPLYRLINGLGIRYVGPQTARILADAIDCLSDFFTWEKPDFEKLKDTGPVMAGAIHAFFSKKKNRETIQQIEDAGVKVCEAKKRRMENGPLHGKTFLFTGELEHFTRQKVKDLVERLGGRAVSAVSKKVDYLVRGSDPGSKLDEAQQDGNIEILEEQAFLKMIPENEY